MANEIFDQTKIGQGEAILGLGLIFNEYTGIFGLLLLCDYAFLDSRAFNAILKSLVKPDGTSNSTK